MKHKYTKIAMLCDDHKIPLSIEYMMPHKKQEESFSIMTFEHDIKSVPILLDNMYINVPHYTNINVCGDKAFVTSETFYCNGKNIKIITPNRHHSKKMTMRLLKAQNELLKTTTIKMNNLHKISGKRYASYIVKIQKIQNKIKELNKNQNEKHTKHDSKLLKKRHVIENYFFSLKKYERTVIRKDHKINTYMSFIYMANIKTLVKKYYDML